MSLSEIIAKIEPDESLKFTRELMAIRFVLKKGDERAPHKEVSIMVNPQAIELGRLDVLAFEVDRAFTAIRK